MNKEFFEKHRYSKTFITEQRFQHLNDCVSSGCPTHLMELWALPKSDQYIIFLDGEEYLLMDENEYECLMNLRKANDKETTVQDDSTPDSRTH